MYIKFIRTLIKVPFTKISKMQKIEYRAYIKTCALLGLAATDISNELSLIYGDNAPKYRTVSKWNALFVDVREDLEDDPRSGRQITSHTKQNIDYHNLPVNRFCPYWCHINGFTNNIKLLHQ